MYKKDISMDHPVYEIKNFDRNILNSLYVNSFKKHLIKHHFIETMHRHNFYLLVLFTSGNGEHVIDFDKFTICSGSLFFMQPGQIHSWKLSQDVEGYIVFCSKEMFNLYFKTKKIEEYSYFQSFKNSPELLLSNQQMNQITPYFELLIQEYDLNLMYKNDKMLNLLDTIFIEITRLYSAVNTIDQPVYNYKLKQFETELEAYFKTEKSPSFYAGKLAITLKHLNRITKSILNKTVTELITQRLLLESKRLMVERNLNTSQISYALGFSSPSYFMKLFKKHTGETTKDFINRLKN
jgi:AraC-like DNA-binding protein